MLSRALTVLVGRESTAGTTATSMRPLIVEGVQMPLGDTSTEMLEVQRSSPYQHDSAAMVHGLQRRSPCKLAMAAKYPPSQLGGAATAPVAITNAAALSQELVLEHWLGGRVGAQGSAIDGAGSTDTVLDVTAGHGSRFTAGQIAIFYVAGVPAPRQVTGVSTDALTIYPSLSAAPAAAQVVLGSRTYHRAEAHTQTLTIEAAHTQSGTPDAQQRGRMVRGQCAWAAEIGQRATLAFDGVSQAHDLGDLSISTAVVADDMGADVVWTGASYLWSSAVATAPTAVCIEKLTVTIPNSWREQACLSGVEGASGVVMTGGRTPPTVEITMRWDAQGAAMMAGYAAGTTYSLLAYATRGTGTSQSWAGWFAGVMAFDAEPTRVDLDGEVMVVCKFRCLANTKAADSPLASGSTDAERSPIVYFLA
jgi:hypothetical protein